MTLWAAPPINRNPWHSWSANGRSKVTSVRAAGTTNGKPTEATSVIRQRFKDCVYEELLTGTRNERPHQLLGLYSYNNLSDKLQWVGGHSEHGVLTLYEGDFVDDELILEYSMMLRSRLIYFRIVITKTRDGFDLRSERSSDKKLWDAGWYRSYRKGEIEKITR